MADDAYANNKPSGSAPKGIGSNPSLHRYRTDASDPAPLPVPWWFIPEAARRYHHMELEEQDVIVSSGTRMGTTWFTKLMVSLLYEYDDEGKLKPDAEADRAKYPGRFGQTYPEALYRNREEKDRDPSGVYARLPGGRPLSDKLFGNFVFDDLRNQPRPRMFVSHMFGEKHLPHQLFDDASAGRKGKGRLVLVVRNLKDTLVSLHHFRGTAIDGWHGNDHGPGSLRRFLRMEDCPNTMGSHFCFVRENAQAVERIGTERALVVYYESLIANFGTQLRRINDFLGLGELTAARARAIEEACRFKAMSATGMRTSINCRKGGIGGWKDAELDDEHWAEFDRYFNRAFEGVKMVEPLRFYQFKEVPGMPPVPWRECDLDTDPREWPPYLLVSLREGMIVPDTSNPYTSNGSPSTQFRSTIGPGRFLRLDETYRDGSPRFHLFVAGACPMASSVAAARVILGLEHLVSLDVADGQSGAGWAFLNGVTCSPWKDRTGTFWLHEAYQMTDPLCTSDIRVPVLWDTLSNKIVSNDAWEILTLLSDAASDLGLCSCPKDVLEVIPKQSGNTPTLFPDSKRQEIDKIFTSTIQPMHDAVFGSGFEYLANGCVETQQTLEGRAKVFALLDKLEATLGNSHRYLLGSDLTGADVGLALCLLQFDACYWDAFSLRKSDGYKGPILTADVYPNLKAYARDVYQFVKPAVHWESFRQIYRLRGAIEFTRQSYSCSVAPKEAIDDTIREKLPDLHTIAAALEKA